MQMELYHMMRHTRASWKIKLPGMIIKGMYLKDMQYV